MVEITEKLDKKIPDVMIVKLPKFRAITSGNRENWDELMSWAWQENRFESLFRDIIFDCCDFLIRYDDRDEFIMAVKDNVTAADAKPFDIIEFEGGLYAMAMSINDDYESIEKVEWKISRWLETTNFEYDNDASRGVMGHMPYIDDDVVKGLGFEQLQRYLPIKLKGGI